MDIAQQQPESGTQQDALEVAVGDDAGEPAGGVEDGRDAEPLVHDLERDLPIVGDTHVISLAVDGST